MKLLLLLALFTLSACASQSKCELLSPEKTEIFADSVNRSQLIGRWIGESKTKDGSTVQEFIERRVDGSFVVHFKMQEGGKSREQTEAGLWGIAGGVYFTLTRAIVEKNGKILPVDVKDAVYYDAYKALSISPSAFTYKSLSTGEQFTVSRVGDSFRF